jgi:predicted dienelactone hydrolase
MLLLAGPAQAMSPLTNGGAAVGTAAINPLVLHDAQRNKDLSCRITYPVRSQSPCPVVIFSHGALGSKDAYDYLIDYLAQHGYVCIQPTHEDSLQLVDPSKGLMHAATMKSWVPNNPQLWNGRVSDVSLIIDNLSAIERKLPVGIDAGKIACAGHSLGAFTSALIGGAEPPEPDKRKDCRDERVKAVVLFSPQGIRSSASDFGFDNEAAWRHMDLPVLFMTGTLDTTKFASAVGNRAVGFLNCPAGDKYEVVVAGASHMTFTGKGNGSLVGYDESSSRAQPFRQYLTRCLDKSMPPESGDRQEMLSAICAVTTSFLDAYLRQDTAGKKQLLAPGPFGNIVEVKSR